MSNLAIRVDHLTKQYRLGSIGGGTLPGAKADRIIACSGKRVLTFTGTGAATGKAHTHGRTFVHAAASMPFTRSAGLATSIV